MRSLKEFSAVYLHLGASDMRLGMDRLSEKVQSELNRTVFSGGIFVFVSRCRRRVKLFYWDRDGYALWMKRLEAGVFHIERKDGYEQIRAVELEELLSGIELSRIKVRHDAARGLYG